MKNVLYIGYLKNRSFGDDIAFHVLKKYIELKYRDDMNLVEFDLRGDDDRNPSSYPAPGYDYYIIGGGTCVTNMEYQTDRVGAYMAKNRYRYSLLGSGVYFPSIEERPDQMKMVSEKTTETTRSYVDGAEFIGLRDEASCEYLRNISTRNDINALYDPVLSTIYPERERANSKKTIGVNICTDSIGCPGTIGMNNDKVFRHILDFMIKSKDVYDFKFVPFNTADHRFFSTMKKINVPCTEHTSVNGILDVMRTVDLFIGIRVHSCLTAARFAIPFLPIGYTYPHYNVLNHIGYTKHIVNAREFPGICIGDKVNDLVAEYTDIENQLRNVVAVAKKTYYEGVDRLCDLILN